MDTAEFNKLINNGASFLVANDGQFLGRLSLNKNILDSISNEYGLYGNKYSLTSIFNKYCTYGNPNSLLSPFNPYSTTPPAIYLRGQQIGYLTANKFIKGGIDPSRLNEWMEINKLLYF